MVYTKKKKKIYFITVLKPESQRFKKLAEMVSYEKDLFPCLADGHFCKCSSVTVICVCSQADSFYEDINHIELEST